MPSEQLIELVDQFNKSGINIVFTKPRSKLPLFRQCDLQRKIKQKGSEKPCKKWKQTTLKFI